MKATWTNLKNQNKHFFINNKKDSVASTVKLALYKDIIFKTLNRHFRIELKVAKYSKTFWWQNAEQKGLEETCNYLGIKKVDTSKSVKK